MSKCRRRVLITILYILYGQEIKEFTTGRGFFTHIFSKPIILISFNLSQQTKVQSVSGDSKARKCNFIPYLYYIFICYEMCSKCRRIVRERYSVSYHILKSIGLSRDQVVKTQWYFLLASHELRNSDGHY